MSRADGKTPFCKILIANRGEVALRVIATARRLGYRTVSTYSQADARARHVREADEAIAIGAAPARESYLSIEKLIAAARACGADAIHPGYGFLAENADFSRAARAAGLVFIGPSPEQAEAMGHKARAKSLMARAGVPIAPGYDGDDQDEARLFDEARRIGFPLMVKAVVGGGGRGIRLVAGEAAFADSLRQARSEALSAFGDGAIMLEKAIVDARHIEVQVFGDRYGHGVHMGERDCSVQRRRQKLIEETPSPALSAELRTRMCEASVRAVQAMSYEGAGTLEFLVDGLDNFYFMEMNTRLQVEHCATEAVTGLDLVEWQLRIAAGEPLPLSQKEIAFNGHAIEVRLCAEAPEREFLPQTGTIVRWSPPGELRVETALEDGAEISPHYDSMIAKLIAHGPDRDEARRKLIDGLSRTICLGVATNQGFLARALNHEEFAAGRATTAFVGANNEDLLAKPLTTDEAGRAGLCLFLARMDPRFLAQGRHLGPPFAAPLVIDVDGVRYALSVWRERDGAFCVEAGGGRHLARLPAPELIVSGLLRLEIDGRSSDFGFHLGQEALFVQCGADQMIVVDASLAPKSQGDAQAGSGNVAAAMSGRIVGVHAAIGDRVEKGQKLFTLEAMKMEHVHRAGASGKVIELAAAPDAQARAGDILARLELEVQANG